MFTVKVIEHDGRERLYEAESVDVRTDRTRSIPNEAMTVMFKTPSGGEFAFDSGDIWVMNAAGKTVADYHMWQEKKEIPMETLKA
jgi:hypothetical protein